MTAIVNNGEDQWPTDWKHRHIQRHTKIHTCTGTRTHIRTGKHSRKTHTDTEINTETHRGSIASRLGQSLSCIDLITWRIYYHFYHLLPSTKDCCSGVYRLLRTSSFVILEATLSTNFELDVNCSIWMDIRWWGSPCLRGTVSGDLEKAPANTSSELYPQFGYWWAILFLMKDRRG